MTNASTHQPAATANAGPMFRAQAIRFARHGAGSLASAVIILCGVPAMMYPLIWLLDPQTVRMMLQEPAGYQTAFRICTWMGLPWFLMFEVTQVRPLYVLPMTNRRIVNGQLACGMLAIAGLHLFTVVFYRIVFGATVPFWGPLLMMCPAVVVAAGLAALLVDFRWWRPFVVAVAVFGMVRLSGLRELTLYAIPWVSLPPSGWLTPTVVEVFSIVILAAIGYQLALQGVERDRCGELRSWPDLETLLNSFAARLSRFWRSPVASDPYRSGTSAQFWFEWWQKGLVLPIIAACIYGISLIGAYDRPHQWLSGLVRALPMIFGLLLTVAGLIVGLVNIGRKGMVISEYRATRPLTDAQLAYAVLKAALASVLTTALVLGIFAVIVIVWSWVRFPASFVVSQVFAQRGSEPGAIDAFPASSELAVALAVGWCLLGLGASLAMAGRGWVMALPMVLVIGAFLTGPLLARLPLSVQALDLLLRTAGWTALACLVFGTIAAYAVAIRRRIIGVGGAWIGGVIALAAMALLSIFSNSIVETRLNAWAMVAFAVLLAAPLATAPLALSWNRHR